MKRPENKQFIEALIHELDENDRMQAGSEPASEFQSAHTAEQLIILKEKLESSVVDFQFGFTGRVMTKIRQSGIRQRNQQQLYKIMLRLSMTAVAAVLLLLIFIVWQENSLSLDGLLGIAGLKSDDFINLLASY